MPRLGLGIHEFGAAGKKLVDPKAKPWGDDRECGGRRDKRGTPWQIMPA
jgi:hypothetical protein